MDEATSGINVNLIQISLFFPGKKTKIQNTVKCSELLSRNERSKGTGMNINSLSVIYLKILKFNPQAKNWLRVNVV